MADDPYARIAELEAELAASRQRETARAAEIVALRAAAGARNYTLAEALE